MSAIERCELLDISSLIPPETRGAYQKLSCATRDTINARYWWLADPLWAQGPNERRAAHLHRQTILLMHAGLTADEHFDYRPKYGGVAVNDMVLRYGWPNVSWFDVIEDENHNGWLGWRDSASNASHEYFKPRYHTAPPYSVLSDLSRLQA